MSRIRSKRGRKKTKPLESLGKKRADKIYRNLK